MASLTIRLHPLDNVVIARSELRPGMTLAAESVTAVAVVPEGHKISTVAIPHGTAITRYGQIIGTASKDIAPGEHVHTHNCAMRDVAHDYQFSTALTRLQPIEPVATFHGIVRPDGRVATRNYLAIISS